MLRVPSPLSDDLETLIHDTIGACIRVHRALGPGLLEMVYSRAISLELGATGIPFEREKTYHVMYRDVILCEQRLDFVVAGELVLEIKSVEQLIPVHHAQILAYMRLAHLPVGLLMNFNEVVLQDGLKRKVL
jgi:GxxExxY protein